MARAILNLSVSPEAASAVTAEAEKRGSKVSPLVDEILRDYFDGREEDEDRTGTRNG